MLHVNCRYSNLHFIDEDIESQSDWFSKLVNDRARIRILNPVYSFYHTSYQYQKWLRTTLAKGATILIFYGGMVYFCYLFILWPMCFLFSVLLSCPKFTSHATLCRATFMCVQTACRPNSNAHSGSADLGWGLRACIPNKLPDNMDASGPQPQFE